ncbi:basic salivary proline-rich protein 3-like [Pteronotus mesoamericanus]|uniref:basic salivary proline-rich protein 3-like n=1 Tax=Pteronotus mesoamericanus TaxID=1884717 RepID=UPI0023EE1C5E|nr:basic salivary proline-rich protein 3-like [Pteronotus parnellii mesoamericanus]
MHNRDSKKYLLIVTIPPGVGKRLLQEGNDPDKQFESSPATPGTEGLHVNDRIQIAKLPAETNPDTPSPHDSSGATSRFRKQQILPRGQAGGTPGMFSPRGVSPQPAGNPRRRGAPPREPRLQHPRRKGLFAQSAPPPPPRFRHTPGSEGEARRKKTRIPRLPPPERGRGEAGAPAESRGPRSSPRPPRCRAISEGFAAEEGIPELRPPGPPPAGLTIPAKTLKETRTMRSHLPRPESGWGRRRHVPSHPRGHTPPGRRRPLGPAARTAPPPLPCP